MTTQAFKDRIMGELLPIFCNDPSRAWGCSGFREDWDKVKPGDAVDFLRGLDAGLVKHQERGLYRAPRSRATVQFFWSGRKNTLPRRVTLWVEPIITVAALSRLHFDRGWPKDLLGTESPKYEFDATAFRPSDSDNEYIACEVKKTVAELNQLTELMLDPDLHRSKNSSKSINASRKLKGLQERRAPVFWALGPGGEHRVFRTTYTDGGSVRLEVAPDDVLTYPGP